MNLARKRCPKLGSVFGFFLLMSLLFLLGSLAGGAQALLNSTTGRSFRAK